MKDYYYYIRDRENRDGILERNKSVYNPELTNHEKQILFPRKK